MKQKIDETNKEIRFSIITVCYNAGKLIARTAQSVAEQSYKPIEYLIIDGLSRDDTLAQVRAIYPHAIIKSERDKGLYDAMNKGIRLASGDYVWFLNAGDTLPEKDCIENLAKKIREEGKAELPDLIYGDTMLVDGAGNELGLRRLRPPLDLSWRDYSNGMLVCHQAFLPRRDLAVQYNLRYRFSSDYDWSIRILQSAKQVFNSQMILANYLDEGGVTKENHLKSLLERFQIMRKYFGLGLTLRKHLFFLFKKVR